jgi:hypothetical protein
MRGDDVRAFEGAIPVRPVPPATPLEHVANHMVRLATAVEQAVARLDAARRPTQQRLDVIIALLALIAAGVVVIVARGMS